MFQRFSFEEYVVTFATDIVIQNAVFTAMSWLVPRGPTEGVVRQNGTYRVGNYTNLSGETLAFLGPQKFWKKTKQKCNSVLNGASIFSPPW